MKGKKRKARVLTTLVSAAILTVFPSITKASWYSPVRHRVRWSPYAFTYKKSGLVPGYVKYCPYAFTYKHPSGLVHEDVHWSPYAFSYKRSGLIADYNWSYTSFLHDSHYRLHDPHYLPITIIHYAHLPCIPNTPNLSSKIKQSSQQRINARKARIQELKSHRAKINEVVGNDPIKKIYEHLQNKNINFKTNNFLKISNKTISVNLFLPGNLMIKYWNPEEINSLYGYKKNFYENYKNRWEEDSKRYKKQGQQIHTINRLEDLVHIVN